MLVLFCAVRAVPRHQGTAWRNKLLTNFAPEASQEYVANMSQRHAALPPLPPFAAQYLNLVELSLTGTLMPPDARSECHPDKPLHLPPGREVGENAGTCFAVNTDPFNANRRLIGRDWPTHSMTMVGHARLRNVRHCLESAFASGVPGDFVELGVWRGGASIYARAVLNVLLGEDTPSTLRRVRLFDAFGLIEGYGAASEFLAVSLPAVKANVATYGFNEGVEYHMGLFNESLPRFYEDHKNNPHQKVSVLRIDGNFAESYHDALYYMWDFVPVGGFVIFDDFSAENTQRNSNAGQLHRCWLDFRRAHGLTEKLLTIDWSSSFFRKTTNVKVDWNAHKVDKERLQARESKKVAGAVVARRGRRGAARSGMAA